MRKIYLFVFGILCAGISFGQVKIGTTNYSNLRLAFAAINSNVYSGAITIEITSDFNDSQETILNTQPSSPNVTSILIKPTAGTATFTMNFNGLFFVKRGGFTIDGENRLIIRQNLTANYGIWFKGPIQDITITNCKILAAERGMCIFLDTSIEGYGTNITNVTVTNCDLGSINNATPIKYGIYSSEHASPAGTVRNGIFTSNKIHDFGDSLTSMYSSGISLYQTAGILINANKFYQSVSRYYNSLNAIELRYVMTFTGDGPTTISNNQIGGDNETNTGTWNMLSGSFTPILVEAFSATYTISNNTIRRIAMADGNSSTGVGFSGIYARKGEAIISGNTIGTIDGGNSIAMNYSGSTKTAFVYGINSSITSPSTTASNNNIGGISINGSGRYEMVGIMNSASTGLANFICDGNTIGSATGNFMLCTSTATGCGLSGIKQQGPRIGTITSNTVKGLTANFPGDNSVIFISGIDYSDTYEYGSTRVVSSNTVQNIRSVNATGKSFTTGIRAFTSTGELLSEKNQVSMIYSNSVNNDSQATGMYVQGASLLFRNNMVSIGTDITSGPVIYGVFAIRGTGGGYRHFQNNSIYVGGTKSSGDVMSIALYHLNAGTNVGSYNLDINDNIFVNMRTNSGSGTGANYSAKLPIQHYSRANLFYGTGNGYIMSSSFSIDYPTLAQINALSSTESPSFFGNPQFISPTDLHIKPSTPTIVEAHGFGAVPYVAVVDDIDGQTRSGLSPNDIGADAGNFLPLTTPVITSLSATSICSTSTFTISGNGFYDVSSVKVGSTNVAYTVNSGTQITVTPIATNLSGQVSVQNVSGIGTSSQSIEIIAVPSISSQPQSVTMCPGSVSFSVAGSNVGNFQWRRNGVNLTNSGAYSNVNSATLQLTNPDYTQGGVFDVVLTAANAMCSTTSNAATLTFTGPTPTIYAPNGTTGCGQAVTLTTSSQNSALQFDGVNDYVDVPRTFSNDFTIEFWMKTTQNGGGSGYWTNGKGLVDCYEASYDGSASFGTSLLGNKLAFGLGEFYDYNPYSITSSTSVNTGQWVHVAVTRKDGSGEMKIYINGVLDASGTAAQNGGLAPGSIRLGGIKSGGNFYNGSLDEVKMWNTVRTPAQIAEDMNVDLPAGTANLVSNYRFSEGSGTSIANQSNGNASTLANGVTWTSRLIAPPANSTFLWSNGATTPEINATTSGTYTVAITSGGCSVTSLNTFVNITGTPAISGSPNFIVVGGSNTLTATGSSTFNWTPSTGLNTTTGISVVASPLVTTTYTATIPGCGTSATFTVKVLPATSASDNALDFDGTSDFVEIPSQNTAITNNFTVMMWAKPTHPTNNMVLFSTRSGGATFDIQILGGNQIHGDIGSGNDWLTTNANGSFNYQPNAWMHVAYVVTPSGYKIYANGNEVGAGSFSGTPLLYNTAIPILLGKNPGENTFFQGAMDDLVIYPSALTATQIMSATKNPPAGFTARYTFDEGIAGANNPTVTYLNEDNVNGNFHGTLNTFALNGATSNWVEGQSTQNQTITFNPLVNVIYGSNFNLSANASSGLEVSYTSSNPSVATVSGNVVTIVGVGSTLISAIQNGNAFYNAATTVTQSLTVTQKALTITSAVAQNKVYDRNTDATISGTLSGIVGSDNVTFSGTGTFTTMNVGNGIPVTSNLTLAGAQSGNYTLTQPSNLSANITPKALMVNNAVANNKLYDGTTAATISGATLSGIISPDDVLIASTAGTFASSSVGNNIAVTPQLTLGGANSGNYSVIQPVGLSANITTNNYTAILSGTTTICEGQSANLSVVISDSSLSFTVQYTDGFVIYTVNNYTSGSEIAVSPWLTATYTLVSVTNASATVFLSGSATVTVNAVQIYYADTDLDGYGDPSASIESCTGAPSGYVANDTDCNPNDTSSWQLATLYTDNDADGYSTSSQGLCFGNSIPNGYSFTSNGPDCDDTNASIFRLDTWFTDADSDGYSTESNLVCYGNSVPAGIELTTNGPDCDDNNAAVHTTFEFYVDADNDGFGTGNLVAACAENADTPPTGYALTNTDCNDNNATVHTTFEFYVDGDGDGFGTGNLVSVCAENASTPPVGYSQNNTDCYDSYAGYFQNILIYADEDQDGYSIYSYYACIGNEVPYGYSLTSNGNDCNDSNPEVHAVFEFFVDADLDGYGAGNAVLDCAVDANTPPTGYSLNNFDCDDNLGAINPGATEILYNGMDENCDGNLDEGHQLLSNVQASQCGVTLSAINSVIGAVSFSNTTMYRYQVYKVVGGNLTGGPQYVERAQPYFTFTNMASYDYATTYSIRVQLQRNGIWLGYYGTACQVSTPALLGNPNGAGTINPSQCGITLPTIATLIATPSLQSATGYKFRVTNVTDPLAPGQIQEIERIQNYFALTMLPNYFYGTTYTVEVAVRTNGQFSGYGAVCPISSPGVPMINNCDQHMAQPVNYISTTNLNKVTSYRFEVSLVDVNDVPISSSTIDRTLSYFNFNMLQNYVPGGKYSVRVALRTTGFLSPFGDACYVYAPVSSRHTADFKPEAMQSHFDATVFPNPYVESFSLNFDSTSEEKIQLRIYDMIGKMLEEIDFETTQIELAQFGERYPAGVYNIVLTQGGNVKTLRVIKR